MDIIPIRRALISVYNKTGLLPLVKTLDQFGITLVSTGGTAEWLKRHGFSYTAVEECTGFPDMMGGRVKTLHPHIFGGILAKRNHPTDLHDLASLGMAAIDLVIVDLYPFSEQWFASLSEDERIELIDIGGVSLLRAAAKNFKDVLVCPGREHFEDVRQALEQSGGGSTLSFRKQMATRSFGHTLRYEMNIWSWMADLPAPPAWPTEESFALRYGENPHQKAHFFHEKPLPFTVISGKTLSYNNLLDLDAGISLLHALPPRATFILKHNNPCGCAVDENGLMSLKKAWAGDAISAFGGVICTHHVVTTEMATWLHSQFFEVLLAPDYMPEALALLTTKPQRILLKKNLGPTTVPMIKSALGGWLWQEPDTQVSEPGAWEWVSEVPEKEIPITDVTLAEILVKHAKSNAMVLVKDQQLLGIGCGMVSRIDAMKQAISKAKEGGHSLGGSVLGSDAFFPFPDVINLAQNNGIQWIWQPGGAIRDAEVVAAARATGIGMVFGKIRHFRH